MLPVMSDRTKPPRPLVEGNEESAAAGGGRFPATRWGMVLAVGAQHSGEAAAALEQLCQLYWLPVYVFIRDSATCFKSVDQSGKEIAVPEG